MSQVAGVKLVVNKSFVEAVVDQEEDDEQLPRTLTAPARYEGYVLEKELEGVSTLTADHPLQWVESTPPPSPVMSYRCVPMAGVPCNQGLPLTRIDRDESHVGSESVQNCDMPVPPGKDHPKEEESTSASEDSEAALLRSRTSCGIWYPPGPAAAALHVAGAPMVLPQAGFAPQAMVLPVPEPPISISGAAAMVPAVMAATGPLAAVVTAPASTSTRGPAVNLVAPTYAAAMQVVGVPAALVSTVPAALVSTVSATPEMIARTTAAPFPWLMPKDMPVPVPMSMPGMPEMPVSEQKIPFGTRHQFHEETITMGDVSNDRRDFVKREFMGRLSIITEDQINHGGILHYAVQFTEGELSNADGVGFILSSKLPSPKNIQKIVSIFANRTGRICVRAQSEVVRCDMSVKRIHIGDWVSARIDLDRRLAKFTVWPSSGGAPSSATLDFGAILDAKRRTMPSLPKTASGYFACVVKHTGVGVRLGS